MSLLNYIYRKTFNYLFFLIFYPTTRLFNPCQINHRSRDDVVAINYRQTFTNLVFCDVKVVTGRAIPEGKT